MREAGEKNEATRQESFVLSRVVAMDEMNTTLN